MRRHKYQAESTTGYHRARSDWLKHIEPAGQFDSCNPIKGNFTAVVLTLCSGTHPQDYGTGISPLIMKELEVSGSLRNTQEVLKNIQNEVSTHMNELKGETGQENWILRALLQKLEI